MPDYAYDFREQWLCVEMTIASSKNGRATCVARAVLRDWNYDLF